MTLESVSSQPGSWSGLELFESARDSRIEHLVLRHAGRPSPETLSDCSGSASRFGIAINFRAQPGLVPEPGMVRNSTLSDLGVGTTGVIRGWYVTAPGALPVSFLSSSLGNTFPGVACRQSGYVEVGPPPMCTAACE